LPRSARIGKVMAKSRGGFASADLWGTGTGDRSRGIFPVRETRAGLMPPAGRAAGAARSRPVHSLGASRASAG
jgi:hypothetical protein